MASGISKTDDAMARTGLYEVAHVLLTRSGSFSTLKRWVPEVARLCGSRRAKLALVRRLTMILHR